MAVYYTLMLLFPKNRRVKILPRNLFPFNDGWEIPQQENFRVRGRSRMVIKFSGIWELLRPPAPYNGLGQNLGRGPERGD